MAHDAKLCHDEDMFDGDLVSYGQVESYLSASFEEVLESVIQSPGSESESNGKWR